MGGGALWLSVLCLSCGLAAGRGLPRSPDKEGVSPQWGEGAPLNSTESPENRTALAALCEDEGGFDAAIVSEEGALLLLRDGQVWSLPYGALPAPARPIAAVWPGVGEGLQAVLRLRNRTLLIADGQVWAFAAGQALPGYPRPMEEEFPGVPSDVNAAVECPEDECGGDTVIFFRGAAVFSFDATLRVAKRRHWPDLGPCDAAVRWLGRSFCLRGANFWRFHPRTGEVPGGYPRALRDYFIPCPGRGHAHTNVSWGADGDPCSGAPVQALLSDDNGRIFAFRGNLSWRLDEWRSGLHPWPLAQVWPGLEGPVGAAFAWEGRSFLIQGSQVWAFLPDRRPVEGFPRPIQEEFGVSSIDAAFTCPGSSTLYIIQGSHLRALALAQSPRVPGAPRALALADVDAAMCTRDGLFLLRGPSFHQYPSAQALLGAPSPAPPQSVAQHFFHCNREE